MWNPDPQELALGLHLLCNSDALKNKYRRLDPPKPTMRNVYRVLARLTDPLGFIVPFRNVRFLCSTSGEKSVWDDLPSHDDVLKPSLTWEEELQHLSHISLPRCHVGCGMDISNLQRDLHITADASEKAYCSVAYLRPENTQVLCGSVVPNCQIRRSSKETANCAEAGALCCTDRCTVRIGPITGEKKKS